ncbi:MAG: tetratricopeptide repeat protein [Candidatus Obscuribacterales bacterium]|nr:tetratricopeptide repeat protein [Candidatus Obscuribacterales bacterium]
MSQEPNNLSQDEEIQSNEPQDSSIFPAEILNTTVDKDSVVSFIEGMVQAMGSAATGQQLQPHPIQRKPEVRKYQSKGVQQIIQKLDRVKKYPDTVKDVLGDPTIHEWLGHNGCKQREYFEELECAQELISFFGGYRRFDLAIQAANKALNITNLHRRDDDETTAELNWVLADLHAASDRMDEAMQFMSRCLDLLEPGSGNNENHPTYKELLAQLKETNERTRILVNA